MQHQESVADRGQTVRRSTGILDLPWDIVLANILPLRSLSFQDCWNLLKVTQGQCLGLTDAELRTFLADPSMNSFWRTKFISLYPSLYLLTKSSYHSYQPDETSWFSRIQTRAATGQDVQRILAIYRREKLRFLLQRHTERQEGFLSQLLASDPTDIRYPCDCNSRSVNGPDRRYIPKLTVTIGDGLTAVPQNLHVYGFEIWQSHDVTGAATNDVPWLCQARTTFFSPTPPGSVTSEMDAKDELKLLSNLDAPLSQSASELLVASGILAELDDRAVSVSRFIRPSAELPNSALSDTSNLETRRRCLEEDKGILPIGSFVQYRTQALIGFTESPTKIGAIIGWSTREVNSGQRSVTYHVVPVTHPVTAADVEADPDRYFVTRHRIQPVCHMTWLESVSKETIEFVKSASFQQFGHPFFEEFDRGRFLVPCPDLATLYPDDRSAQMQLNETKQT